MQFLIGSFLLYGSPFIGLGAFIAGLVGKFGFLKSLLVGVGSCIFSIIVGFWLLDGSLNTQPLPDEPVQSRKYVPSYPTD